MSLSRSDAPGRKGGRAAAVDALRSNGWLSKVPRAFRKAVLDRCQVREVEAGAAVYRIGDPPTGLFGEARTLATICDDLMRRDPVERVVAMVLHFAGCRDATLHPVGRVTLDVGQNDVASAANVGRTMAGVVLRDLEMAGEIELAYHRIHVLAPDALRSRLA